MFICLLFTVRTLAHTHTRAISKLTFDNANIRRHRRPCRRRPISNGNGSNAMFFITIIDQNNINTVCHKYLLPNIYSM